MIIDINESNEVYDLDNWNKFKN